MFRPIRMDHTNCLQVAIKTLLLLLILASGTPKNFRFFRKSCLSTDLAPVMKLTWSTFQPCRWITVLMALQRVAYWFSAVFLALAR
jgi:hypothetical protein